MKKIMKINGMTCGHCQARVEKALNSIEGVKAKVDLKKAQALLSLDAPVADEVLIKAVTEAGYHVTDVQEKKGLFS
ncbi:MAG: heavy-metal-associated domain-containing protein [Ruminococcaceae bacterium]|jgi:copper chaperone CopZ|nr:heavy-metal-associated domain-containing protein [Oscillospiraceae bacterium]